MKTSLALLGCLALTTTFAATAADMSGYPPRSTVVDYHDLDLANPDQAAVLYTRIQRAAKTVCPLYTILDLERVQVWRRCYKEAVANAVLSVDHPMLTALHEGTGRTRLAARHTEGSTSQ